MIQLDGLEQLASIERVIAKAEAAARRIPPRELTDDAGLFALGLQARSSGGHVEEWLEHRQWFAALWLHRRGW